MTITPRDIRQVTFGKPALGRRGYSEDDVDPFLEQVADELEERLIEIDTLKRNLETAETRLENLIPAEPETNPLPVLAPQDRPATNPTGETAQVTEILQMAAETAARYKAEAEARAERTQQQAQEAAQRVLAGAREQASGIVREAEEQGRQTLALFQSRADNLELLMQGLRDKLRPYFEQNLNDLDLLVPADDDDAPAGAHAKGE